MTQIKFQDDDYHSISVIINRYRELEKELNDVQTKLIELDSKKSSLMSKLDEIRTDEIDFFSIVESKYGKGKFDLMSMNYILENNQ